MVQQYGAAAPVSQQRKESMKSTINKVIETQTGSRSYQAAAQSRIVNGWVTTDNTALYEIQESLQALRARSRQMERDDDYFKRYIDQDVINVIGHEGIKLQSKAGTPDARKAVEAAWKDWGKRENCTVSGNMSWYDVQKLIRRSVVRDGEFFVIIRKTGKYKTQLRLLESDYLDENYMKTAPNGNQILSGVEVNDDGKPIAYHFCKYRIGTNRGVKNGYVRIPAAQVVHCYDIERQGQLRGVPHGHAAMLRLHLLGEYEKAELLAAQVGACKSVYMKTPTGEGDFEIEGRPAFGMEPGTIEVLPPGWEPMFVDPKHGGVQFAVFIKQLLRGIASGMGMSYNNLSNDLEGVSYSSLRSGALLERDNYRQGQSSTSGWFQQIFDVWIQQQTLTKNVNGMTASLKEEYSQVKWRPRGWKWVDPQKDITAAKDARAMGWRSDFDIAAELGEDFEQNLQDNQRADAMREEYGQAQPVEGSNTQTQNGNENEQNGTTAEAE